MGRSHWRVGALLAAGVLALAVAAAALGNTSRSSAAKAEGGSLTVWLGGTYAGATPGSSYRKWLDGIKARYEKAYPGSTVKFVLTPINNAQFTAQIAAAFASRKVPDAMLVYSGGYTTPYMLSRSRSSTTRSARRRASTAPRPPGISPASVSTARAARGISTPSRTISAPTGSSTTRRCSSERASRTTGDVHGAARACVAQGEGHPPACVRRSRRLLDGQLGDA